MNNITCLDLYGNVIHYFTQWDLNQKIYIEDSEFTTAPEFHFQNKNTPKALVVKSTMDNNGIISVDVPNQLMTEPYPIMIYVYMTSNNSSKVVASMNIPVYARQQPNDYIYNGNVEYVSIKELEGRINELSEMIGSLFAKDIHYDNSISGLMATNVQDALDEIVDNLILMDDYETPDSGGDNSGDSNDTTENEEYVPTGEVVYLYNEGVTSDLVGGWNFKHDGSGNRMYNTFTETNKYLQITSPQGTICNSILSSTNRIDISAYDKVGIKFSYAGKVDSSGDYKYNYMMTFNESVEYGGVSSTLILKATTSTSMTNAYTTVDASKFDYSNGYFILTTLATSAATASSDLVLKIHQIWLEKAPGPSDAEKISEAKNVIQDAINSMTATNDTTQSAIQAIVDKALTDAGINDVTATVNDISKTNATSSSTGSLTGVVDITCGTVSDSVDISKTIATIPKTDKEKIADAKSVVEKAINSMTATNDTTQASIQTVVDNALTNAGIKDVTATVGSISKTNATSSGAGKVTGNVALACGTASDSVNINKAIAQLPKTDDEKLAEAKAKAETVIAGLTATNDTNANTIINAVKAEVDKLGYGIAVTLPDFKKTSATSSSAGSVTGNITLTLNQKTVKVPVNKAIAKLPKTDAEKLAEAKVKAEAVIANTTATNDITANTIINAVKTEVDKLNYGITVTLPDFKKTNATTSAAGNVTGTVTLTLNSSKATATVNLPIAQLEKTNAEKLAEAKVKAETVVNNLTASNNTTAQSIIDAVKEEVDKLGYGITVTLPDFAKTNATSGSAGSVTGNVTLTLGNNKETVTVNKTIKSLPAESVVLYDSGETSDILGGFTNNNSTFNYSVESDHLAVTFPAGVEASGGYEDIDNALVSNNSINPMALVHRSDFDTLPCNIVIEYEYVYGSTGEPCTYLGTSSNANSHRTLDYHLIEEDGSAYSGSFSRLEKDKTIFTDDTTCDQQVRIAFFKNSSYIFHDTEDIICKIYSIRVEPNVNYDKFVEARTAADTVINNYIATNNTAPADVVSAIQTKVDTLGYGFTVSYLNYGITEATTTSTGEFWANIQIRLGEDYIYFVANITIPKIEG